MHYQTMLDNMLCRQNCADAGTVAEQKYVHRDLLAVVADCRCPPLLPTAAIDCRFHCR